jgi:hypothetical protein
MKNRILSIMATRKKKAGFVTLCVVLVAIIGTGVALAATDKGPGTANSTSGIFEPETTVSTASDTATPTDSVSSNSNSIDILNKDTNFQNSGLKIQELNEPVKIDRATAIKNAEAYVGDSISTEANDITAVLVKLTQDTPINPGFPMYLKDHPAWIVTFHGVTLLKTGPSKTPTVLADENVVIDANSGDALESVAYSKQKTIPVWGSKNLKDIALQVATNNGDPQPTNIRYVNSTRKAAAKFLDNSTVDSDDASYVVIMHGNFIDKNAFTLGAKVPTGNTLSLIIRASDEVVTDFILNNQSYSALDQLGSVSELKTWGQHVNR